MRRTHWTVLIVCEGGAEDALAQVVRDIYLPRNCGTVMQRRNAHGYGGERALQIALELSRQTQHNAYGVMLDTDAHWTDAHREKANDAQITVIENDPCLEATLLRLDGERVYATTRENKAAFEARYGSPPHRDGVIRRNFTKSKFDLARARLAAIDALLRLIRC